MWQQVTQPGSLTARIVSQVEQLLREESLKPGDRLPSEREMAQLLGVSRPSLREAVRILEARGRLSVKHGQGVFVEASHSERELRAAAAMAEMTLNELYAMREVLEVPAAMWAADNITPEQQSELRSILDRMEQIVAADEPDWDELGKLDAEFHMVIAAAAANRFLHQTSHVLYDILRSGMETTLTIPGRTAIARRDHERIYDALAAGDAAAARRAVRAHIRGARAAAMRRVEQREAADKA